MSIIRIKVSRVFLKGELVSKEYKLWGIPILRYTYKKKGSDLIRALNPSEGVPLSVQESL